jgi:hypothetical protein|tara:strand:+ start:457 stop:627 length:171 start_codon:yes stop_codon:yes gene_type:complete
MEKIYIRNPKYKNQDKIDETIKGIKKLEEAAKESLKLKKLKGKKKSGNVESKELDV